MAIKKPDNMTLEENLAELEQLVVKLENSEISLEDALKQYERGIQLVRASQAKLANAEQKIRVLQQKDGAQSLVETDEQSLLNDH